MTRLRFLRPTLTVAALALIAACAGGTEAADGGGGVADGFPVTIEHALGETTVPDRPERIVAIGEDVDTLAALGITPVGYAPLVPDREDDVPYLAERIDLSGAEVLDGYETGELSVERIAALEPDLILGTNFFGMPELYDQLSRIAPTVAYEKAWGESTWQDMTRTIGRTVGEEEAAERAVRATEQDLADLRAELPGLAGRTVAGVSYYEAGTFATNPRSASMDTYLALGMEVHPALLEAKPEDAPDNSVSLEQIDVLDADYLSVGFASDDLRTQLEANPLYRGLRAVRAGTVRVVEPEDTLELYAGNSPSVLNVPWVLEQQRDELERVAALPR